MRDLSAQFLALAEKHGATGPLLIAHRIMGISLATTGDIATGRAHFDRALALYDPAEHRALATRFSVDAAMSILSYRSWTIWALGILRLHSRTPTMRSKLRATSAKPAH